MRKIENEVMIKQIETTWEAVDGTVFNNALDCEKYEQSYKCTIINSFNKIPQTNVSGGNFYCPFYCDDNDVITILPRNMDDIVVINAYAKCMTGVDSELTQEHIGKHLIINLGYDYDWFDVMVMDKLLADIAARYNEEIIKLNTIANPNKEKDEG